MSKRRETTIPVVISSKKILQDNQILKDKSNDCILFTPYVLSQVLSNIVSEKDVGIENFLGCHQPCSGIFRHRYSDFIVREIDLNNNTLKFTDFEENQSENFRSDEDVKLLTPLSEDELWSKCEEVLGLEFTVILKNCYLNGKMGNSDCAQLIIPDKNKRYEVHTFIRNNFTDLTSKTIKNENGESVVQILKCTSSQKKRDLACNRASKSLLYSFYLYKENIDTIQAVSLLARFAKTSAKNFSWAGTKDKRGITCQKVTVKNIELNKLKKARASLKNMKIGHFLPAEKELRLGELKGNQFSIVIREFSGDLQNLGDSMNHVASVGFINYFGMQRFGTTSVSTHMVGRELLKGDWKSAVALLLVPRPCEPLEIAEARLYLKNNPNGYKETLKLLPKRYTAESSILHALSLGKSFQAAFLSIPSRLQTMYTHAYQSYVWNKMATERLKQNKLKAIAGDLIVIDACTELGALTFEVHMRDKNQIKVHKVTNEEETLQIFDISMVSLPLPGYAVFIPENIAGKKYEELLSEDHVEPSLFIKKNLSGGYRKLVVPVENLSWDFLKYSDRNEVLTLSDFEEFQGKTLPSGDTEGPYKAIRINFSLPSSCYASMALREIMKMDTTTAFNRDLSERLKNGKTLNSEKKLNGDQYEIEF